MPGFGRRHSAAGRGRWLEEKGRRPAVAAGVGVPSAAAVGAESSGGRRSCPYYCRELSASKERTEKPILTNEGKMVSIQVFYGVAHSQAEHWDPQLSNSTNEYFFFSERKKKKEKERRVIRSDVQGKGNTRSQIPRSRIYNHPSSAHLPTPSTTLPDSGDPRRRRTLSESSLHVIP